MKVGTVEIHNRKFKIELLPNGVFRTDLDGDTIKSSTKTALIQQLRTMLPNAVRVEIPATWVSSDKLTPIVLTGLHSTNGNLLYKVLGKKGVQQMYKWSRHENVLRPLDDGDRAEFKALVKAQWGAQKAVDAWLKARRINPRKVVRKALGTPAKVEP